MLKKEWISNIEIHSDAWHAGRLGKFTASEVHSLMGEKEWTKEALSYVYRKVGEEMTGMPYRDDIDTPATRHGLLYEADAIKEFGRVKGLKFVVVQKLITEPGSRIGCTPDFLVVSQESRDKSGYIVQTGEVKCPVTYNAYIGLFLCETPFDVKREKREYYWQVLFQMYVCDALVGHLVVYHPDFRSGNMKIIEFRKRDLLSDFGLLSKRVQMAEHKFAEVRDRLLNHSHSQK